MSDNWYANPTGYWDGGLDPELEPGYDHLDSEGEAFAGSMIPAMEQLLNQVGGIIETMGIFAALLNNAGQMYANADYNSDMQSGSLAESPVEGGYQGPHSGGGAS
jgi:hypothetical protein